MKILVCNNRYFISGGPERYLFTFVGELSRRGHEVIPLCMAYQRNLPCRYSVHFIPPPTGPERVFLHELELSLIAAFKLASAIIYNPKVRRRTRRLIRHFAIDIVYALQIGNFLFPETILGAADGNVPVVWRLSDFQLVCLNYLLLRDERPCTLCQRSLWFGVRHRCLRGSVSFSLLRALSLWVAQLLGTVRKVDAFITPSRFTATLLARFGLPKKKLIHLPTPVQADRFTPQYHPGNFFLFVGSTRPHKGLKLAVEAVGRLGPRASLLVAADMNNPEGQEIIALTKKNRWHNIHFLGWCPQEEIIRHFQNALALIFPSLCYENMPNVVLEAMACGKPVLASNLGSLPELVQHQITGLLATPGQREEFIRCLDWMLTHSHRLVAMGKAARRRIEVDFSTTGHYNALTKIFSHLVEQRRRT